ncbi:N-glycosylase/DNA lyase [Thermococcus sp.]
MGNCDLNEELAERVAKFLLKIPDDVWEGLFDELPEFQKMPEEFKNWSFGKQAVILMVGALNDYRTKSEDYWKEFYESFGTPPKEPENFEDLKGMLKSVQRICKNLKSRKCTRMKKLLENKGKKFVEKLWKKNESYFKENIGLIWEELADVMGQCKEDKTMALAMKDLLFS